MAKDAKNQPAGQEVNFLDELLNLDISEIKAQTPSGGSRGGKRSAWDNLTDEQKKLIHKKILVNNSIAAKFRVGEIEEAQFFVISDTMTNEKTPVIKRGQKVAFVQDNQTVFTTVVGFVQAGTGKKLEYKDGEKTITFPVSGMSIETPLGDKAIARVSLNPKEPAPAPTEDVATEEGVDTTA